MISLILIDSFGYWNIRNFKAFYHKLWSQNSWHDFFNDF